MTARQVLVVDDDDDHRLLVMMRVRQLGWTVSGAATGAQAIEIAGEQPLVLAIIDIGLPDMRGWDLITRLRDDPHTAEVPIMVLSNLDPPPAWLAKDVAAYLMKPFHAAELQSVVTTILGRPGDAARR